MVSNLQQAQPAGLFAMIEQCCSQSICSISQALSRSLLMSPPFLLHVFMQVADNGKGVPPEDHAALALKYHTSKISQFQDLEVRSASTA